MLSLGMKPISLVSLHHAKMFELQMLNGQP